MSAATLTPAPPQPLETARRLHARGQLLQAAETYRCILATEPRSQPSLLGLSLIARQSRQLLPAIKMAQTALVSGPNSAVAWANYGDLLAALHKIPQAQIALAWMLQKPYITSPIVGTTRPQHLEDAVAALSVKLSTEEITRLEELYVPHPVLGFE